MYPRSTCFFKFVGIFPKIARDLFESNGNLFIECKTLRWKTQSIYSIFNQCVQTNFTLFVADTWHNFASRSRFTVKMQIYGLDLGRSHISLSLAAQDKGVPFSCNNPLLFFSLLVRVSWDCEVAGPVFPRRLVSPPTRQTTRLPLEIWEWGSNGTNEDRSALNKDICSTCTCICTTVEWHIVACFFIYCMQQGSLIL